jgi:hypothetical protein
MWTIFLSPETIVTASVTEEIKRKRKEKQNEEKPNRTDEPTGETKPAEESNLTQRDESVKEEVEPTMSHLGMTSKERNNSKEIREQGSSAHLTGKLCKRVMALIRWKVGADKAVSEHMVWALEGWLRRRGISIYADLL